MSAEAPILIRSFRVGRYECTMSFRQPVRGQVQHCFTAEWSPSVPRRLSPSQLREYRRGRDSAIAELAAMIGGSALVIE